MKVEAKLKSKFSAKVKEQLPHYVVQLFSSAGSPDRSITGDDFTSHWEFKHATPRVPPQGLQELTCMRLERQGHCRYVIWHDLGGFTSTLIIKPHAFVEAQRSKVDYRFVAESLCNGFDMDWLVSEVHRTHYLKGGTK